MLTALYAEGAATRGHTVLRDFALVVASSGGSLVATGLVTNATLGEIANFFAKQKNRDDVFVRPGTTSGAGPA